MTRTNIKKLYLGVYTKDGDHIPVRLISLIATPDNKWRGGIRKNNDSIGIIISNYEISENGYDTAAFHEYELKDVDKIIMSTTWDHYSNEETAKAELMRSERTIDSELPYERSIEGIAHYGYCMEAKITGPSDKYPGCTVLQRKYALIDEEFAKSMIFAYCKASLMENDLLEDNQ